jgi:hypothetical protein
MVRDLEAYLAERLTQPTAPAIGGHGPNKLTKPAPTTLPGASEAIYSVQAGRVSVR